MSDQNFKFISHWMTADKLIDQNIIKRGGMIEIRHFGYSHWAITVKQIETQNNIDWEVILFTFTDETRDKSKAKIVRGWLREAAGSSVICINNGRDEKEEKFGLSLDSTDKIIDRAEGRISITYIRF